MPRRKAIPEDQLVKLPKTGNFDKQLRLYLETYPPDYTPPPSYNYKLALPIPDTPKLRDHSNRLLGIIRNALLKVPKVDVDSKRIKSGKQDKLLFRMDSKGELYLSHPLTETRIAQSESILDDITTNIVFYYQIEADKARAVRESINARQAAYIVDFKTGFQMVPERVLSKAISETNKVFEYVRKAQAIDIRKSSRSYLTKSIYSCLRPDPPLSPAMSAYRELITTRTPKISKEAARYVIALIYIHLGIETGKPSEVAERIRKDLSSKPKETD